MNYPYSGPAAPGSGRPYLVSGPFPVSMGDRGTAPTPTETLVFSTSDGSVVELPKRPGAFSATKYSYRYIVDGSDHLVSWDEHLPSGTGGFDFQAALEARWRVASATEVVRRNITGVADGEAAVRQAMREMLWPHTATYGIERLSALDTFVRSSFSGRPHKLAEGLVVTNLAVRLHLDPVAAEHLRSIKQREFDRQIAAVQHDNDKALQGYQSELQTQREQAILAAARGEGGLILMMIAQDPSKMREVLAELADRQEVALSHKRQVLKDLMEAKLIQPSDAEDLWQDMNRPTPLFGGTAAALPTAPTGTQPQLIAGAVAPRPSPPTPRFQGGGPTTTGTNAAGANTAEPNTGATSGPATTGTTGPVPRFNSEPGPSPGSGAGPGSGPAATPAPSPGDGSQSSATSNVVGAVPVGRKHRADRPGK